jgi:pimeloyl-ACP methyl ester carboxylesterase
MNKINQMKRSFYMQHSKNVLRVPGALLSYEVCGNGPILLLIAGGGSDSHSFDGIVGRLANDYSVVTYDRRGISSSKLDDLAEEQRVEVHSDDAHRLLIELGSEYEPAYAFGSSGGAIIGLDLVARHPEQIYTLIAHEPPTHLLPDADPIQEMGVVREVYFHEGFMAAFQAMMAMPDLHMDRPEMNLKPMREEDKDQTIKNLRFLFEHEFAMYDRYQLDFATLKRASTLVRIVLAGGDDNKDNAIYKSAMAVADRLGTTVVDFPGRHIGYITHPRAFSQRLSEILSE